MNGIKITNLGKNTQWCMFENTKTYEGVLLEVGANTVLKEDWGKVRNTPWVKRLIKNKNIEVGTEVEMDNSKKVTEKINSTNDLEELNKMLDETDNSSVKAKISRKIKKMNDGE